MKSLISGILFLTGSFLLCPENVSAQDYRIYTRVFHQTRAQQSEKSKVIARSLTIWHAGKVYDYMDSVGELVIYDPHQQRFTVISGPHHMACTIDFSELRQFLKVARSEAKEYLTELGDSQRLNATQEAELVAFQLDPHFKIEYRDKEKKISCIGPQLSYTVDAMPAPSPEIAEAFKQYADWAAQLNFVLHGKSMMPAPRLQVNEQLLKHQLLPIKVTLSLVDVAKTKLTAEHAINWELGKHDRSRVAEWKHLLRDGELKFVSFHEYQRHMIAGYKKK